MSGVAAAVAAGVTAVGGYLSAKEQKKAAEAAARGSEVTPWGPTGPHMESLINDAMAAFNSGNFNFGPSPDLYNSYLKFGENSLGLDLDGYRLPEAKGYGPGAYQSMLSMIQGPAFAGAQRSNPQALMNVPNPWMSGLVGGLGGYLVAGGEFGREDPRDLLNTIDQMQLDPYQFYLATTGAPGAGPSFGGFF